jgi:carotenoid 1,2-hydratase
MTERGSRQVTRDATLLSIGPSQVQWDGDSLRVTIDEICAPLPRRLRGTIRLIPASLHEQSFALDAAGLHRWTPLAPAARVEVSLRQPALHWSGGGYFDSNCGSVPLEDTFQEWTWSRVSLPDRTVVLYDTRPRGEPPRSLALDFEGQGAARTIDPPVSAQLPRTRWGLTRSTRGDPDARVVRTLVDAPFYSRSQLALTMMGTRATAIHESLSLDRFRAAWVQCLLPFRMPRIVRRA